MSGGIDRSAASRGLAPKIAKTSIDSCQQSPSAVLLFTLMTRPSAVNLPDSRIVRLKVRGSLR